MRTAVIKTLSTETETQTLDSLQQTAMAFRVITHESTELSDESQVQQNIFFITIIYSTTSGL